MKKKSRRIFTKWSATQLVVWHFFCTSKVRGNSERPIKNCWEMTPNLARFTILPALFSNWKCLNFRTSKWLELFKSNFDLCLPFVYGGLHEFASNIASVARSDIKLSVAMQFIKIQVTLAQEVKVTLLMNYLRYTIKCYEWIQNLRLENVMIPDLYLKNASKVSLRHFGAKIELFSLIFYLIIKNRIDK